MKIKFMFIRICKNSVYTTKYILIVELDSRVIIWVKTHIYITYIKYLVG